MQKWLVRRNHGTDYQHLLNLKKLSTQMSLQAQKRGSGGGGVK
jgi:hypothetical protein